MEPAKPEKAAQAAKETLLIPPEKKKRMSRTPVRH